MGEHLMLLVKYIMQLTVSAMPASVENEIRKKKYEQERKRYKTLRAKKERRSGSVGISGIMAAGSMGGERSTSPKSLKMNSSFKTSPCSPIREWSAGSYSQPSPANPEEVCHQKDEVADKKPNGAKGQGVGVHATTYHSPPLDQYSSHRRASRQKLPSRNQYSQSIGKHSGGLSSSEIKHENNHPNFEEVLSKLPWPPPPSRERSPLQARHCGLNNSSPKYMPSAYLGKRSEGTPYQNAHQADGSRRDAEVVGRSRLHHNELLSPSSSLSTVPGMPTPCHLNLESDDETLYTVEDAVTPTASEFYPEATAPPLSPSKPSYSSQTKLSSGLGYFGDYSKDSMSNDDSDHSGTKAKWGVHHILHYANSEKKLSLSERKKAR